jgi:hypothetical protein
MGEQAGPQIATVREYVADRVARGSLRGVAAEIGVGHTSLAYFLDGGSPRSRPWRLPRARYGAARPSPGAEGTDDRSRVLPTHVAAGPGSPVYLLRCPECMNPDERRRRDQARADLLARAQDVRGRASDALERARLARAASCALLRACAELRERPIPRGSR